MPVRSGSRPIPSVGESPGAPVVVVYDTEVRAAGQWKKAPRLTVHLDRGDPSELTELGWRSDGGAEAVVAFDDGMTAFRGHRRLADGSSEDYRGVECERWSDLEGTREDRVRVFATEEDRDGDGGDGTDEGRLSLLLDDGRGAVERVTWRDRRGTFASLALRRTAPPAARGTVPVAVTKVVADAEYRRAGEVAANLLDAGRGKWLAFESTATLDFVLPEPTAVTAYRLTAANDYRDRDPRDWRLRGSVDGHTWITLDSRLDQAFPQRHQVREYAVANSTPYPLYRLDIGRNWGRQPETQLNRVELLTTDDAELVGTPVPVTRVEASGEHWSAGEVAANLLDAGGGKWLTFSSTATLDFVLAKPGVVTAYTLTSANDHCSRDPKDWVLRASQDGLTWVTVDRRSGEMFTERFLAREFTTSVTTPYARYRLDVTANAEGVGEIQLQGVRLVMKRNDDRSTTGQEFSGVLRDEHGPTVGYRGRTVAHEVVRRRVGSPDGKHPAAGFRNRESRAKLDRFRDAALARGIPADDVERWLGLARPCLVLASDVDGPVVGHFGTPVMLPPDVALPRLYDVPVGELSDDPSEEPGFEHLVATLDLGALPEGVTNLPLPPDGRLLLFAWPALEASEDHSCTSGSVVYVPAGTMVEERKVEYDYEPDHELGDVDFDGELRGELRVRYDVSLPDYENFNGDPLLEEHPRAEELREVWADVRADGYWHKGPQLQLGGYALDAQGWGDPVRGCAYAAGDDGPRLKNWALLAQWHPGMYNLESVTMYWAMSERDLAARRFTGARVAMYAH
ncbi:hypothetical protein GCM10022384_43040 [Streptomyces marokkonensis]|uniref:OAA-family lectin sugar binding domain-containing protein n=1 Tax=Streptomyces marokkonensis TaxID=324855 RepID=A0ABP7QZQ3_9ACTN